MSEELEDLNQRDMPEGIRNWIHSFFRHEEEIERLNKKISNLQAQLNTLIKRVVKLEGKVLPATKLVFTLGNPTNQI